MTERPYPMRYVPLPSQRGYLEKMADATLQGWRTVFPSRALALCRYSQATMRPYEVTDRGLTMRDLGPVLARAYPGGDSWLSDRLDSVLDGKALCTVVCDERGLSGITIETPKGSKKRKLSTIWVAEHARGKGLGARMLDSCRERWAKSGVDDVWITVGDSALESVARLVMTRGFERIAVEKNRYGEGRDEHVFGWRVDAEDSVRAESRSGVATSPVARSL